MKMGNIHFREANLSDAANLIEYLKIVMGETNFMRMYPEEVKFSIQEEEAFIKAMNEQENSTLQIALDGTKIVAVAGIHGQQFLKFRHCGEFGISVLKEYWGRGIGKELTIRLLDWCKKNETLKKVILHVNVENLVAIHLYKSLGFKQEGLLTNDFCYEGRFIDTFIFGIQV